MRLFLTESALLVVASTARGIGVAYAAVKAIVMLAPADVPRLSSASADLRVLGWGLMCGFIGTVVLTRLLRTLLFGVTPTDFMTFVVVAVALSAVAMAATVAPALRAARVDPLSTIRGE